MSERLGSLRSLAYGARRRLSKVVLAGFFTSLAGAAVAEEITIAALGDSLTQGYGLVQEDGFVPQLQAWLRARGHEVTVINAGVSGDTTAGGLARVGWTLTPEVDAMIVALGGNDLLRGIAPEASRANLEGILQAADAGSVEVLLVGLQAPGNYGPDYKAAFDAMYPDLARAYGALHAESFLGGLETAAEGDRTGAIARYMQADGIHPNAEGVARIVEALGPEVEALIARVPRS
ncbi:arylesterase [Boseongicola sp. H5]|uniref:arylesterase n=1 Tax=Boseongicola sp. H5 TaxID=2763261 RepID=UPI001D0A61B9|nr:arylesterase [Boseongicola sp. H5]